MKNLFTPPFFVNLLTLVFTLTFSFLTLAQEATEKVFTGNKSLTSQVAVTTFGENDYTSITGNLIIEEATDDDITDLSSLNTITSVRGDLQIGGLSGNSSLTSLSGLDAITSVGRNLQIWSNAALTSLSVLDAITSVGGFLNIQSNAALTSLSGLDAITSVGGNLWIRFNAALTDFCGIKPLLDAGFSGSYNVSSNSLDPTVDEVKALNCTLNVNTFFDETFSLYPNPTADGILRLNTSENKDYEITVMDSLGNLLIQGTISREKSIDLSGLASGVYFVKISYKNQSIVKKIVR